MGLFCWGELEGPRLPLQDVSSTAVLNGREA